MQPGCACAAAPPANDSRSAASTAAAAAPASRLGEAMADAAMLVWWSGFRGAEERQREPHSGGAVGPKAGWSLVREAGGGLCSSLFSRVVTPVAGYASAALVPGMTAPRPLWRQLRSSVRHSGLQP